MSERKQWSRLIGWSRLRSHVALLCVAVLAGWWPAGSAFGHGADGLAYQGVRGPYLVSVFDARPTGASGQAEYRLVLSRAAPSASPGEPEAAAPVAGARVEVTDTSGQVRRAEGIGSVYYVTLPDRDQRLAITISSALGATSLEVEVHALPKAAARDSSRGASLVVLAVVVACLAVASWLVLRRRPPTAAPGEVPA